MAVVLAVILVELASSAGNILADRVAFVVAFVVVVLLKRVIVITGVVKVNSHHWLSASRARLRGCNRDCPPAPEAVARGVPVRVGGQSSGLGKRKGAELSRLGPM